MRESAHAASASGEREGQRHRASRHIQEDCYMDETIRQALATGLTCDITTTGRTSGKPRRIEIWYVLIDGRVYITGTPGPRDWYANLLAQPRFVFHIKEGAQADLPARAIAITDSTERRQILGAVMRSNSWFRAQNYDLDAWVAASPLVEVIFE
jgi:deazaflavin-dependent oxidoreductase (nitroreductase family)